MGPQEIKFIYVINVNAIIIYYTILHLIGDIVFAVRALHTDYAC